VRRNSDIGVWLYRHSFRRFIGMRGTLSNTWDYMYLMSRSRTRNPCPPEANPKDLLWDGISGVMAGT